MFSWLKGLFQGGPLKHRSRVLYSKIVSKARDEYFYQKLGVPDTLDGRFDMILLHLYPVVVRLENDSDDQNRKLSQFILEALIDDMDRSLREMGVGDLSVGKHIKKMSSAWFGRKQAYGEALASGSEDDLMLAVSRNIFGREEATMQASALAGYFKTAVIEIGFQEIDTLCRGEFRWPAL